MNQEFAQAMQCFIQHIRQRYPTSSTATHYQSDLEQFGQVVDKAPRTVTRADVGHFVTVQLAQDLSAATVNRRLATLSSFFDFLADEANDDYWANPVVWRMHRVRQGRHLPRDLSEAIARQFWQAVRLGPVRDQAIVALMLDVGLRVSEVMALRVQEFEPTPYSGELPSLRVQGKGDGSTELAEVKERRVWLAPETAAWVQNWLAERPAVVDDALFITRRRRGFTVRGIQDRVKHYAQRAGLQPDQVSCHRLRHTFARRMAEARMPLPSLSHWLGHSQLKTTQIYIDGANPDVQADGSTELAEVYQAAMERLSETAERLEHRAIPIAESIVPTPSRTEPVPSLNASAAPPLAATDIDRMALELPAWLLPHTVTFLLAKQVRWQPYHRRRRARQWLGELRRAWTWLLDQRQVTGFADLSRSDLSAYPSG